MSPERQTKSSKRNPWPDVLAAESPGRLPLFNVLLNICTWVRNIEPDRLTEFPELMGAPEVLRRAGGDSTLEAMGQAAHHALLAAIESLRSDELTYQAGIAAFGASPDYANQKMANRIETYVDRHFVISDTFQQHRYKAVYLVTNYLCRKEIQPTATTSHLAHKERDQLLSYYRPLMRLHFCALASQRTRHWAENIGQDDYIYRDPMPGRLLDAVVDFRRTFASAAELAELCARSALSYETPELKGLIRNLITSNPLVTKSVESFELVSWVDTTQYMAGEASQFEALMRSAIEYRWTAWYQGELGVMAIDNIAGLSVRAGTLLEIELDEADAALVRRKLRQTVAETVITPARRGQLRCSMHQAVWDYVQTLANDSTTLLNTVDPFTAHS